MKNVLWDFDGVILDSMPIREWGFRELFKDFSHQSVEELIKFHSRNGGLSRYVKIRYFFENILGKNISEEKIIEYATIFSNLMRKKLVDEKYLIKDSLLFIKANQHRYNFHIVSGSDEKELQFLCKELNIDELFISIKGSPTPKNNLVKDLLIRYDYDPNSTCLIGDSINDFEAAKINKVSFYGFNNVGLKGYGAGYICSFENLKLENV